MPHDDDKTPQEKAKRPPAPAKSGERYSSLRTALMRSALAAAAFTVVLAIVFTADHYSSSESVVLDDPAIIDLKAELMNNPKDEALKERIRVLDLSMRQKFFTRQERISIGKYLLLAGALVFVAALKLRHTLERKMPKAGPTLSVELDDAIAGRSRVSVGAVAFVTAGAILALGLACSSPLHAPKPAGGGGGGDGADAGQPEDVPQPPAVKYATAEEMAANWPRLFGPGGRSTYTGGEMPTTWDGEAGTNILWKTKFPLPGASSPVVWGDKLYVTGADTNKRQVYCVSTKDGSILWQADTGSIPGGGLPIKDLWDQYTYAASTPATDGHRVYAGFANGDVICLDSEGKTVWARGMGPLYNGYGHASSLCIYERTLIMVYDQSKPKKGEKDEFRSKIVALDLATGKTVWETPRPSLDAWATPLVAELAGKKQIIAPGNPYAFSYDVATGKELWRVKCLAGDVTPSAVVGPGLVYAGMEGGEFVAIKPDGEGDVTETHIAWRMEDDVPSIPTPACDGERVYVLAGTGIMTCYEASAGKKLWEADLELAFMASPVIVGDKIYMFADDGENVIVKAGPEIEELARNSLGEEVRGTPAFAGGRMYVRGHEHLMCIGSAAQ